MFDEGSKCEILSLTLLYALSILIFGIKISLTPSNLISLVSKTWSWSVAGAVQLVTTSTLTSTGVSGILLLPSGP